MTAEEVRELKHELRTPINHIIGYSELLLESAVDAGEESVTERAKTLHDAGRTLTLLVDTHFATFNEKTLAGAADKLRKEVTPVIAAIVENAKTQMNDGEVWRQDFSRISNAAQKIASVLECQEVVM